METDKKINVLHLRDSPWVDGPGRTIIESAATIDKERFNYIIGAFTGSKKECPLIEVAIQRNLNVFPIIEEKSIDIRVFKQILDYIDKNNVHILHSHEFRSNLIALVCAKIKKKQVTTTLHGWIPNDLKRKLFVALDKCLLHFFDHIIVVSEKMKEQVLSLKISEKKISVIQNAILAEKYQPDKLNQEFRNEIGAATDTILIGKIGRLSPEKGHRDLIQAIHEVHKSHDNIKLVLIGIGPEQRELESLVDKLNLNNTVIFTGYRKDMQRIYNSLDIVVQSSYTEGMPNVLLEALLMEVPVIATDVGGTPEIIIDYQTGVLISPRDYKAISIKIKEYIEKPTNYKHMVQSGRLHVQQKFNFRDRTKKVVKVYEKLMTNFEP